MTYTDEELKASLRLAIGALELTPDYGINHSSVKDDDKASAVLRAYFDKFDEDRAFVAACKIFIPWFLDVDTVKYGPPIDDSVSAYRALMAKEKP